MASSFIPGEFGPTEGYFFTTKGCKLERRRNLEFYIQKGVFPVKCTLVKVTGTTELGVVKMGLNFEFAVLEIGI